MEQNFVYVDANYLKELEETAKKVDYYKGVIDGINLAIDRKDEPQTYITEDRDTQILDAWQVHHRNTTSVEDEPQTERPCDTCANKGNHNGECRNCVADSKPIRWETPSHYKPKTEPQTERNIE